MTKLYMAYGSNLNLRQMGFRCPTAKVYGTGQLQDYRLIFSRVATIVPEKGSMVPVAIWEIDAECEKALDRYEGFPNLYRKEYLTVTVNGKEIEAMVYIMNTGKPQLPPRSYYETIKEGYHDVGFDTVHLDTAVQKTRERMLDGWAM